MQLELGPRLQTVASFIPKGAFLCDVGSDHAYLPVYAVQKGILSGAIAGEVVQGPYESAKQTVSSHHLGDVIAVRLGDGLEVIHPDDSVTCVTICGMGGELISQILERGLQQNRLKGQEILVLQPNVAEHLVRNWLHSHGYSITDERVVSDHDRLYEIIIATPLESKEELTAVQLQYGPRLMEKPTDVVIQKWMRQLNKLQQILEQLQKSTHPQEEKVAAFTAQYEALKGVIEDANRKRNYPAI